jgi:hypothetical protein
MQSLLELQRDLAAALLGDAGPSPGLAVYRGNVFGNWAKALAGAFPIVRKLLGEEFFDAMARQYARAHPSRSGDLNRYGDRLPEFVADFPHTADLPYLPDVARMEWLAHRAWFAEDPASFDTSALSRIPSERYPALRPRLAAACAVLESAWPLGRLWTIHQDDYEGAFEVDLDAGPDRILVHRPRWRAQVLSLSPGDFRFLGGAVRGETLGESLEAAAVVDSQFDPSMALARWIDARIITNLA